MKFVLALLIALPVNAEPLGTHPTLMAMAAKSNAVRDKNGIDGHGANERLNKAAQDQAWYMARMHDRGDEDFNHRGGNGTPGQRAARHGYCGTVMENIARGYPSVDKAFAAWQASDHHLGAILSETTEAGFGYAVARDGTTYWVAVYGRSQCSPK